MALNPTIPQKSLPLGIYPVTLHTLTAIKTYNRTCERIDRNLYLAQIAVRVRGELSRRFETEIAQVEAMLVGHLDKLERQLADQRKHLHKLLRKSGVTPDPEAVPYSQPATITIKVKTPWAGQYVKLLQELDTLTRLVDLAWYHGMIDAAQQLRLTLTMHGWFITQTNSIANLARGLARRVSERGDGVDANYAAMLKKRLGVAPTDAAPLDEESLTMTAAEQAELADTMVLSAALEQAGSESGAEPAIAVEADVESKDPDEAEVPVAADSGDTADAPAPGADSETADAPALGAETEHARSKLARVLRGGQT